MDVYIFCLYAKQKDRLPGGTANAMDTLLYQECKNREEDVWRYVADLQIHQRNSHEFMTALVAGAKEAELSGGINSTVAMSKFAKRNGYSRARDNGAKYLRSKGWLANFAKAQIVKAQQELIKLSATEQSSSDVTGQSGQEVTKLLADYWSVPKGPLSTAFTQR
jgi:hypothetical protein